MGQGLQHQQGWEHTDGDCQGDCQNRAIGENHFMQTKAVPVCRSALFVYSPVAHLSVLITSRSGWCVGTNRSSHPQVTGRTINKIYRSSHPAALTERLVRQAQRLNAEQTESWRCADSWKAYSRSGLVGGCNTRAMPNGARTAFAQRSSNQP